MVQRFLKIFNREFGNLNEAALLLGALSLASQLLGLVRDKALAHFLGPSQSLDIYYAAFRLPDFLFVSVASLASVSIVIPFLSSKIEGEDGRQKAAKFMNHVFSAFLILMVCISAILFIFMPKISHLIAPGFSPDSLHKMAFLSRIMLLSPIFLGLSNLFGSITQMAKKFFIFALSPVFYNVGILIGIFFLYPFWGLAGLAWGIVIGAFLHLLIQIPSLIGADFVPKFSFKINWREIKELALISVPRTVALSANSFALIAIVFFASKMSVGSISIYTFALNLETVPLGIIGISYSVAAFPALSKYFARKETDEFLKHIIRAARQIIFWCLPSAFLLIVLRAQIVRVVLGSGAFSWDDTRLTAAALALFAISLVSQSLILLFVRGFYASGNTKTPLFINLFFTIFKIVFTYSLIGFYQTHEAFRFFIESILRVDGIKSTEILMLPLGFSLGTVLNFAFLWIFFKRFVMMPEGRNYSFTKTFIESLVAAFAAGIVSYVGLLVLARYFNLETFWGVLGQGGIAGVFGIGAAILTLYIMKNNELSALIRAFRTKFWKTTAMLPEQAEL